MRRRRTRSCTPGVARRLARGAVLIGAALAMLLLWTGTAWAAPATVVYHGPSDRKQIALTFDDNTTVDRALAVLRALQKDKVPATLFLIGSFVKGTPAINTASSR